MDAPAALSRSKSPLTSVLSRFQITRPRVGIAALDLVVGADGQPTLAELPARVALA